MPPSITLTPKLAAEYEKLFGSLEFTRGPQTDRQVDKLLASRARYEAVAQEFGMPWVFVAVVHMLEGECSFRHHLHNGDPLRARTVNVPAGRPRTGRPPFTWEASADDALRMKGLGNWRDWSVAGMLWQLERYNGFGYRQYHQSVKSPYLWAGSQHYTRGKYVSDGKWSGTAVSQQIGAAVLLKRLIARGAWSFGK